MSMKDAVVAYWSKAFQFSGRARRSEYWLNLLATIFIFLMVGVLVSVTDVMTRGNLHLSEHYQFFVDKLFPYITVIPGMAQASRRLHDINMDGRIAVVFIVLMSIMNFVTSRFPDVFPIKFGGPGWLMVILGLVSILPLLFLFIINFIRGNDGDNKYGRDPKRL